MSNRIHRSHLAFLRRTAPLLILVAWFASTALAADPPPFPLHRSVRPVRLTVGDRAVYEIVCEIPAGRSLQVFPEPSADPDLELDPPQTRVDDVSPTTRRVTIRIPFRVFRPGPRPIPGPRMSWLTSSGTRVWFQPEPFSVEVASVLPEGERKLRDILPPPPLPGTFMRTRLIGGILATLAILVAVGLWEVRRRRDGTGHRTEPQRSLEERTLASLERLEALDWETAEGIASFYSRLADILRDYVAERYHLPGRELTTKELLARLRSIDLTPDRYEQVRDCLEVSDLVKFARYHPAPALAHAHLERMRQFVRQSALQGPPMPE